jgi:7,8-dihydropterin-6-yl-methyl-4-(beta-D-ribofuranosyl)aminobenzene 5'-phosphate synthase
MKIITLVENCSLNESLKSEHGLSLFIKTDRHKILFDTGQTDLFIENAQKLNIDLKDVDIAVISHGHYDHIGGLQAFLNLNQKAKIYLKPEVFESKYYSVRGGKQKFIGFPDGLAQYSDRFVFIENDIFQLDDLYFISQFDQKYPQPTANRFLKKEIDSMLVPDDFSHELLFAVNTDMGLVLFSGCAHNGILNFISALRSFLPAKKICAIVGGFHLPDTDECVENQGSQELDFIAGEITRLCPDACFFTGHCTGSQSFQALSQRINTLSKFNTGMEILL